MSLADQIHLRDYIVAADIGAFQSERGQTQRLRFDLVVDLAQPVTGAEDQVDRILSYDVLTDSIAVALADKRYDLLETLAEKIAAQVLAHPAARRISVSVAKLDRVPGALGITITREAARVASTAGTATRPSLLLMAEDRHRPSGAVVIVPPAPDLPLPQGGNRRRIALLALDQSAWALAGRIGLDVADSRTELDWSIAVGLPVVWAPCRMAADAPDLPAEPLDLAAWLAERLGATEIQIALPADQPLPAAPSGLSVPIRRLP